MASGTLVVGDRKEWSGLGGKAGVDYVKGQGRFGPHQEVSPQGVETWWEEGLLQVGYSRTTNQPGNKGMMGDSGSPVNGVGVGGGAPASRLLQEGLRISLN